MSAHLAGKTWWKVLRPHVPKERSIWIQNLRRHCQVQGSEGNCCHGLFEPEVLAVVSATDHLSPAGISNTQNHVILNDYCFKSPSSGTVCHLVRNNQNGAEHWIFFPPHFILPLINVKALYQASTLDHSWAVRLVFIAFGRLLCFKAGGQFNFQNISPT